MKTSKLSKILGASVLSASLAFLPSNMPASAQLDNDFETREGIGEVQYQEDNDWGAWGLLGLLGLLGLAGLGGRKRHEANTYYADPARDREEVPGRTYR